MCVADLLPVVGPVLEKRKMLAEVKKPVEFIRGKIFMIDAQALARSAKFQRGVQEFRGGNMSRKYR
jgi:hypothetical protein